MRSQVLYRAAQVQKLTLLNLAIIDEYTLQWDCVVCNNIYRCHGMSLHSLCRVKSAQRGGACTNHKTDYIITLTASFCLPDSEATKEVLLKHTSPRVARSA